MDPPNYGSNPTYTSVTVLQAADNLFQQLKVQHDQSIGHANQYIAYRTQVENLQKLQARVTGPPSSIRQRTIERISANVQTAIESMHADLLSMQTILEQLKMLPHSTLSQSDVSRLETFTSAHSQHLVKKQGLLNICMAEGATEGQETDMQKWMELWKSEPDVQEQKKAEMDDLANAFGSW